MSEEKTIIEYLKMAEQADSVEALNKILESHTFDGRSKEAKEIKDAVDSRKLQLLTPPTEIRKKISIKPSQFHSSIHSVQRVEVVAEPGQTLEDIMQPRAWATVAQSIRPWALIDVIAEDSSFYARLFVKSTTRQTVHTEIVYHIKLDKNNTQSDENDYEVKWMGQVKKWCVIRKTDNSIISEGNNAQEDAMSEMVQYEKVIGL